MISILTEGFCQHACGLRRAGALDTAGMLQACGWMDKTTSCCGEGMDAARHHSTKHSSQSRNALDPSGGAAGKPIQREHIHPLDLSGGDRIPHALQPDQDGAVALIHTGILRRKGLFVGGNSLVQGGDLDGDGVVSSLLFGWDPPIEGNAATRHAQASQQPEAD